MGVVFELVKISMVSIADDRVKNIELTGVVSKFDRVRPGDGAVHRKHRGQDGPDP